MTRKFLDTLKSEIATVAADNATGDFVLSEYRTIMGDTIDSTIDDECDIFSTAPSLAVPVTTGWTNITSAYDEVNNRLGIGTITPAHMLDIENLSASVTARIHTDAGDAILLLDSGGADKDSFIGFVDNGTSTWRLMMDTSIDAFRFFDDVNNYDFFL